MIRRLLGAIGAVLLAGLISPAVALADQPVNAPAAAPAADVAAAGPLSDVPLNSWAYDAVNQLIKDGIIKGYPDGTFKGQRPMTRYEAAVLSYRAVDFLEAQITAGKNVSSADIDAAKKLMAQYGNELKAVERHVDALQQEADANKKAIAGQAGQISALNAFTQKGYVKFSVQPESFTYFGNFNLNCGPGTYSGNGGAVGAYCASVGGGNALLQGVRTGAYQNAPGNQPPGQPLPNGQTARGLQYNFNKIIFTGTPSPYQSWLAELGLGARPGTVTGASQVNGVCTPFGNFANLAPGEPATLANCSGALASQAAFAGGEGNAVMFINQLWFQQQLPKSGLFLRVGHLQNTTSIGGLSWLGMDYEWGAMLGISHGPWYGWLAYGTGNAAATNAVVLSVPYPEQTVVADAEYHFNVGKVNVLAGGFYFNSTGYPSVQWDPSAVMCTGAGATRFFANTAAVPFTSCGAGFSPVTYANGAPITGYYLGAVANNPTYNATGNFITPGLSVTNPVSMVGAQLQFLWPNVRLYLAGTYHLGNDPYTGTGYLGPTTGDVQLDIGPWHGGPGTRGKWTYEVQAFAEGQNGQTSNVDNFGGPLLQNTTQSNYNGLYWVNGLVKYWMGDQTWIGMGYQHAGLMPNTTLPASTSFCPGCVLSGFTQNAGYLTLSMFL